jgi:hypothetical protein
MQIINFSGRQDHPTIFRTPEELLQLFAEFLAPIFMNIDNFIDDNSSIWYLFYKYSICYEHTIYGVKARYTNKRIRFIWGNLMVLMTVGFLTTASLVDVSNLSAPGQYA